MVVVSTSRFRTCFLVQEVFLVNETYLVAHDTLGYSQVTQL